MWGFLSVSCIFVRKFLGGVVTQDVLLGHSRVRGVGFGWVGLTAFHETYYLEFVLS